MLAVVSALSGVSIVSNDDDKLVLNIVTNVSMPSTATEGKIAQQPLCNAAGSRLQPVSTVDAVIKSCVRGCQGQHLLSAK